MVRTKSPAKRKAVGVAIPKLPVYSRNCNSSWKEIVSSSKFSLVSGCRWKEQRRRWMQSTRNCSHWALLDAILEAFCDENV
ncbi:hypothetical protein BRADI_1g65782v3 [Brachypodium distachyon]|uniref:Uncharacterized protein n=1 Tax=Brachypodium distachyon TaxID=15368 RepID=A0A2K2DTJ7_BRADI|nr:hypothetical protein BRADI_1g65782v3 [Brachypodium distachyon]